MKYKEYRTTSEQSMFKLVENNLDSLESYHEKITIDSNQEFQEIVGFGASFTDASAFLIDRVLSKKDRQFVMKSLFDSNQGIGISVLRNPMGASDYARTIYSYCDEKDEDDKLSHFSIEHDEESIIPLTREAMDINKDIRLIASPWSAPGWMKDSGSMVTGRLEKKYYDLYAEYFTKFIQAYEAKQIPVYAVTPQNEPLYEPTNYPGMLFLANEELEFVKNHLKPKMNDNHLETLILGYDHNWDRIDYPYYLLDKGKDVFDGIAWHWYGGKAISQKRVERDYHDKGVYFTEGSGGDWIPAFEPAFSNLIRTGIEILRNNAKTFILWNIALDEQNGPTVPNFGNSTCRGLVKVNQKEKTYEFTQDYYGLAHFSKFILPGAKRIYSTESNSIKSVAFRNTDNTIVLVLFNDTAKEVSLGIDGLSNKETFTFLPKETKTIVYQ